MPTVAQIEAESPLTAIRAARLKAAIRASSLYRAEAALYGDLSDVVDGLVDVTTPAEDVIKSQHLSAVVTALDVLKDGTIGVKGGKLGADYSQSRDREALVAEALGVMYDSPLFGTLADGSDGAYAAQPMNAICSSCFSWPCYCGITYILTPHKWG